MLKKTNNWLEKLCLNKKERQIIKLEKLILDIKEKGLLITLLNLKKFQNEIKAVFKDEQFNINIKDIEKLVKNNVEKEIQFNALLEANIKDVSILMLEKNPIIFKLELYKPKLYELELEELIVWIYNVKIKQNKFNIDNKKQFYYLIYNFQQAESISKKQEILLKLLYKIQLYIKHAK